MLRCNTLLQRKIAEFPRLASVTKVDELRLLSMVSFVVPASAGPKLGHKVSELERTGGISEKKFFGTLQRLRKFH